MKHSYPGINIKSIIKTVCLFSLLITAFPSFADAPDGIPVIKVSTNREDWPDNNLPRVAMQSVKTESNPFLWSTYGFTHNLSYGPIVGLGIGLYCGYKANYTATLSTEEAIPYAIDKISAHISFIKADDKEKIKITAEYSDSHDFPADKTYSAYCYKSGLSISDYWNFEIESPQVNRYYRLKIDCPASLEDNSVALLQLLLYADEPELDMPVFNIENSIQGMYSFLSASGELHLVAREYSYDNDKNYIGEIEPYVDNITPFAESEGSASVDLSDPTWLYKVADKGQTAYIEGPEDNSTFIEVHAKTVSGMSHSPEVMKYITLNGIVTSRPVIISDENEPKLWYNLQGQRVSNPSDGIFILISQGKARKIKR